MDNKWSVADIQKNMASRLAQDVQMDTTVEFIGLIQGMVTDKFGRIPKEAVIFEAIQSGMLESDVLDMIDKLVKNRTLKEKDNFLMF